MLVTRAYKIRLDLNDFHVCCFSTDTINTSIKYKQNAKLYQIVQFVFKYNNLDSLESIQKRIDVSSIYPGVVFHVSL